MKRLILQYPAGSSGSVPVVPVMATGRLIGKETHVSVSPNVQLSQVKIPQGHSDIQVILTICPCTDIRDGHIVT